MKIRYTRIRYSQYSLRASSLTTDFAKPDLHRGRLFGAAGSNSTSDWPREFLNFSLRPIASLHSRDASQRFGAGLFWLSPPSTTDESRSIQNCCIHCIDCCITVLTVYLTRHMIICNCIYISQGNIGRFYLASDKAWLM